MAAVYGIVFACIIAFAAATPANFVPFGTAAGDTAATPCDDCSFGPFAFDYIFYGSEKTSLYVNNNGLISFSQPIGTFTPSGMSAANFPAIAVYWGDVDTRGSGDGTVFYRSSTDASLLASVSAQVSSSFHGTHMFIATWDRVGYYSEHNNKLNTFQAVLIADSIGNSWCFLHYDVMQWTTGDASGGSNGVGGVPASVGFAAGDHITYVQTAASLTADVVNTQDGLYQVNSVVIVIPPAQPTQTCGNGIVEGTEACDGDDCCTATCTLSMTGPCQCSRYPSNSIFDQNYFCVDNINQFYQCVHGPWASQSRLMDCGVGTACGCAPGTECSCSGSQSPCVLAGQTQVC